MHIEPGIVDGAKIVLSYATGVAAIAYAGKLALETLQERGVLKLIGGTLATTALTFSFFEVLPHYPVGVSEVHIILGSTLFLLFGAAPAAFGLALGLLVQGLFLAPFDLPQYGMNLTTLLVPLFMISILAKRIIPPSTRYVDVSYGQALALSTAFQGGVIGWVSFWAFYGQGFTAESLTAVGTFGAAYILVVTIEPLIDLLVLAGAKTLRGSFDTGGSLFEPRLYKTT